MKCLSKLFCQRRDVYAEVYSKAYSLSYMDDDYLAKQQVVPSAASGLSGLDYSFASVGSADNFVEGVTTVDLIQLGVEHDEKKQAKNISKSGNLKSMAMKTVTSIEEQEEGEADIETQLEPDELEWTTTTDSGTTDEGLKLDPLDYHVVSKYYAKSKRRILPKTKVAPFMRVKKKIMKTRHFDMIQEDTDPAEEEIPIAAEEVDEQPVKEINLEPTQVVRSISSTSALYIESDTLSF